MFSECRYNLKSGRISCCVKFTHIWQTITINTYMHFAVQTVQSRRRLIFIISYINNIYLSTKHTQLYIFNSILIPQKVFYLYIYTHHQRNLAAQEKPYIQKQMIWKPVLTEQCKTRLYVLMPNFIKLSINTNSFNINQNCDFDLTKSAARMKYPELIHFTKACPANT